MVDSRTVLRVEESRIRDEMQQLLRYANYRKVGEAVGVSRASVADWARGRHVTLGRVEQVRRLLAPNRDIQIEAATPSWAQRLIERVDQIYEAQAALAQSASKAVIEALAPEASQEAASEVDVLLGADVRQPQRTSDEPVEDQVDGPTGGSPGSKRRT